MPRRCVRLVEKSVLVIPNNWVARDSANTDTLSLCSLADHMPRSPRLIQPMYVDDEIATPSTSSPDTHIAGGLRLTTHNPVSGPYK